MEQRVVITGIGAITPVGNHVEDTWKNLVEGNCGIDFIKGYDEYNLPVKVAGDIGRKTGIEHLGTIHKP